jgi:hypothetical protein
VVEARMLELDNDGSMIMGDAEEDYLFEDES